MRETHARSNGRLVVLEGPDGVGKTTLSRALGGLLRNEGENVVEHSFPGDTNGTLGELVYRIHHDPWGVGVTEAISPASQQLLHVAAHVDSIEREILPLLTAGKLVLLDRFWWSTWAYGAASGVETNLLESLVEPELRSWGSILPAPLFLLYRDREPTQEFDEVARRYEDLVARESGRYPVHRIQNKGSVDAVVKRMRTLMLDGA